MRSSNRRFRRAFTLVEIMIVVVIIGLMATIITYATTGMLDKAKHKRAISDIVTLAGAVDLFHGDRCGNARRDNVVFVSPRVRAACFLPILSAIGRGHILPRWSRPWLASTSLKE